VKEGESRNSILSLSLFYWVVIILFSLLVAGVIFWFVRGNRFKRYLSSSAIADSTVSFSERIKILNETEIELIHYLINKSVKGKKTTIEEVNKLAGVAQKSEPTRRRVRSELINSINEKWIVVTGSRDRLITSVKSSFDARTREYYIAEKWLISDIIIQLSKNKLPG
jgi:hydroxymethylpyrimidine/phosphomethylpyrimidine kinase